MTTFRTSSAERSASDPVNCVPMTSAVRPAYRFFANDRVSEAQILAGHF